MWNQVNPFMGYMNNPFAGNSYYPMYGMNQPVFGSPYMMNMAGQTALSTPNPLSYNYPKVPQFSGTQYSAYPKFKETQAESNESTKRSIQNPVTLQLAIKLQEEIKKLEEITSKAKQITLTNFSNGIDRGNSTISTQSGSIADSKSQNLTESHNADNNPTEKVSSDKAEPAEKASRPLSNLRKAKITDFAVTKQEKEKFDSDMQTIMEKLSSIK